MYALQQTENRQIFVIPAQAGIQKPDISAMFSRFLKPDDWIPACAGMTNPYGFCLPQGKYISENNKNILNTYPELTLQIVRQGTATLYQSKLERLYMIRNMGRQAKLRFALGTRLRGRDGYFFAKAFGYKKAV
ncbi:MAG: hypothetical protein Q4G28_08400 [Neisseria sp.]|nr:hypothetical protein [Neisseria sp.]